MAYLLKIFAINFVLLLVLLINSSSNAQSTTYNPKRATLNSKGYCDYKFTSTSNVEWYSFKVDSPKLNIHFSNLFSRNNLKYAIVYSDTDFSSESQIIVDSIQAVKDGTDSWNISFGLSNLITQHNYYLKLNLDSSNVSYTASFRTIKPSLIPTNSCNTNCNLINNPEFNISDNSKSYIYIPNHVSYGSDHWWGEPFFNDGFVYCWQNASTTPQLFNCPTPKINQIPSNAHAIYMGAGKFNSTTLGTNYSESVITKISQTKIIEGENYLLSFWIKGYNKEVITSESYYYSAQNTPYIHVGLLDDITQGVVPASPSNKVDYPALLSTTQNPINSNQNIQVPSKKKWTHQLLQFTIPSGFHTINQSTNDFLWFAADCESPSSNVPINSALYVAYPELYFNPFINTTLQISLCDGNMNLNVPCYPPSYIIDYYEWYSGNTASNFTYSKQTTVPVLNITQAGFYKVVPHFVSELSSYNSPSSNYLIFQVNGIGCQ